MEEIKIIEYVLIALIYIVVIGAFAFSVAKVCNKKDDKNSRADSDDKSRNPNTTRKWEESTRWRKVEDELPDEGLDVLVKYGNNCVTVGYYLSGEWHTDNDAYLSIDFWKPIH